MNFGSQFLSADEQCVRKNRKGGTAQGGTAKIRWWTHVRRNAFAARAQGFPYLIVETRHVDTYPNQLNFRCISDCLWKRFPTGPPLRSSPPCDYALVQKSCRTKAPQIHRTFIPNFALNLPCMFRGLCFPGNGDHRKFTRNLCHFSMPNPQANS